MLAAPLSSFSSILLEHLDKFGSPRLPPKPHDNNYCLYCKRREHTIDKCWCKERSNAMTAVVAHPKNTSSVAVSSPVTSSSVATFSESS